jgi:catechol-2,3-dioxygenase
MAFLRAAGSQNHPDLGLIALGASAPSPLRGSIGLYHLAWEVKTIKDLAVTAEVLKEQGYFRGASDQGSSKSVYGQDPDGNEFEITWLLPREAWGEFEHQAIVAPLNLQWELQRYGV